MSEDNKIIEAVPSGGNMLPVLNPEDAKRAYHAYLELCNAILVPYDKRVVDTNGVVRQESDYARIKQTKKDDTGKWITEYVDAPKKSAFRKLGKFYGISDEIIEKHKEVHENGSFTYHYTVRAIAPNGQHSDGEGSCSSSEKGGKSEHDTRSTAHTRAKSRAISDLIGFGQVSAEEYANYEEDTKPVYRESTVKTQVEPVGDDGSGVYDLASLNSFLLSNGVSIEYGDQVITEESDGKLIVRSPRGGNVYAEADQLLRGIGFTWVKGGLRWEREA